MVFRIRDILALYSASHNPFGTYRTHLGWVNNKHKKTAAKKAVE